MSRALNHVELMYRPGERRLAARVFEMLGCAVVDRGGTFFTAMVEPERSDFMNNCFYASEITAEQLALENALSTAMQSGSLAASSREYRSRLQRVSNRDI